MVREGIIQVSTKWTFLKFLFLVKDVVHYGLNVLLSLLLALLITTFWAFRATYSISYTPHQQGCRTEG